MKVSCRTSSFTNTRNSLITISYRYLNLLLLFGEKTDACCLRFEHQKAFKKKLRLAGRDKRRRANCLLPRMWLSL